MAAMFVAGNKVWESVKLFSPLTLFANGEQGVWYDYSDLTTLFQDHLGTIPAAYGQPVGLCLDKSRGVVPGPERLGSGLVGLVGTATAATYNTSTGSGVVSRGADTSNQSYVTFGDLNSNSFYKFSIQNTGSNSLVVRANGFSGPVLQLVGASQSFSGYLTGGSVLVVCAQINGTTANFTINSVRELPGNHARQATATARPTLMQSGAVPYLYRDPVDDALPWTAPAGSYDIVHIPLTGPATVLTAQALSGAANILLAENTRAYLAIDRRLTAAEIGALAAYYGAST